MNAPFNARREQQPVAVLPRPAHDARDLTGTGTEATILLDGMAYILHITRQGKLILTK